MTSLSLPEGMAVVVDVITGGTVGHTAGDTCVSIEIAQGSNPHDTLTGTQGANELWGMFGSDLLTGLDGNNTLNGALGLDPLAGGRGTERPVGFDDMWLFAAVVCKIGHAGAATDALPLMPMATAPGLRCSLRKCLQDWPGIRCTFRSSPDVRGRVGATHRCLGSNLYTS